MLQRLHEAAKPSERKLRLFSCACGRRIWNLLLAEESRRAVEVGELLADRHVNPAVRQKAWVEADSATSSRQERWRIHAGAAAQAATANCASDAAYDAAEYAKCASAWYAQPRWERGSRVRQLKAAAQERHRQSDRLRDIFGPLPFRAVAFDPTWRTPTVRALCEHAYDERQLPSRTLDARLLAVLADAVEEAGCNNEEVLSHLRQQGAGHVRGCWAVDAVLAKE
jgi:hypothetical protein